MDRGSVIFLIASLSKILPDPLRVTSGRHEGDPPELLRVKCEGGGKLY